MPGCRFNESVRTGSTSSVVAEMVSNFVRSGSELSLKQIDDPLQVLYFQHELFETLLGGTRDRRPPPESWRSSSCFAQSVQIQSLSSLTAVLVVIGSTGPRAG